MGARNKQVVGIARCATAPAIVLAVLFGSSTSSLAAEAGDGDTRAANAGEGRHASGSSAFKAPLAVVGARPGNLRQARGRRRCEAQGPSQKS